MSRLLLALGALIITGLSLTACAGVTIPGASPGEGVTIEDGGDTVTYTDDESGLSVTAGEDVDIPQGFPADLPLPDQANLLSAADSEGYVILSFEWPGMTKNDFLAYIEKAKAAGYMEEEQVSDFDLGDGAFSTSVGLSNGTYEVLVSGLGDATGYGQLSLGAGPAN
jgi:hypothetical protein